MNPFAQEEEEEDSDEEELNNSFHDGPASWRQLTQGLTRKVWADPSTITLQIDAASIINAKGNIDRIRAVLDSHYDHCKNLLNPNMGVFPGKRVPTFDLLGSTNKETATALLDACRSLSVEEANRCYSRWMLGSFEKPCFSILLLAQSLAAVHPGVVVYATDVAVGTFSADQSESTNITIMWFLAQATAVSTPISVYGWIHYILPVTLQPSSTTATIQWALCYVQQLSELPIVIGQEENVVIQSDLLLVLDYCFLDDEVGYILQGIYPFIKKVWMQTANDSDLRDLFFRVIEGLETIRQDNQESRVLELVSIGVSLLVRLPWLYEDWRQKVRQRYNKRHDFVSLIKGSQHLLQYVFELHIHDQLDARQVELTLSQFRALCEKYVQRSNALGVGFEDAVRIKTAAKYFKDLERLLRPAWTGSCLQGMIVAVLLACLFRHLCKNCLLYPCGPIRSCSDLHPCVLLSKSGLDWLIVWGGDSFNDYIWEPLLPYKEAVAENFKTVAAPIIPYINHGSEVTITGYYQFVLPVMTDMVSEMWPILRRVWLWTNDQLLPALYQASEILWMKANHMGIYLWQRVGLPAIEAYDRLRTYSVATFHPYLSRIKTLILDWSSIIWRKIKIATNQWMASMGEVSRHIVNHLWPEALQLADTWGVSTVSWLRIQSDNTMVACDLLLGRIIQWVKGDAWPYVHTWYIVWVCPTWHKVIAPAIQVVTSMGGDVWVRLGGDDVMAVINHWLQENKDTPTMITINGILDIARTIIIWAHWGVAEVLFPAATRLWQVAVEWIMVLLQGGRS